VCKGGGGVEREKEREKERKRILEVAQSADGHLPTNVVVVPDGPGHQCKQDIPVVEMKQSSPTVAHVKMHHPFHLEVQRPGDCNGCTASFKINGLEGCVTSSVR
jgi:hypothetical protein